MVKSHEENKIKILDLMLQTLTSNAAIRLCMLCVGSL